MVIRWWPWTRPRSLGARGERAAARYLRQAGYQIVARHHQDRQGEIDLIVSDGRAVIFVEVKTRRQAGTDHPAESVDARKQLRVSRAALAFLQQHRLHEVPVRFDIVAITWPSGQRRPLIEHFPGAFEMVE
jgi:putative endonuclease